MPTNFSSVVARVNTAQPHLLRANTHAACGEFLQRVCAEPEPRAERVGLLSKSPAENGYTFPNGTRTSHDVICWPNGERVDIISSAGAAPAPGGPTWQVIPPSDWRPTNRWVDISGWPIYDSGATPPPATATVVGFGWFCWMRAWADWPQEAAENEAWILANIAPKVYRVMLAVEGESHGSPDPWRDASVRIDSTWEDRFKQMLDHVGGQSRQVHCTVYGGRNQTPTHDDRRRFHDRIVAAAQGRWQAIRSWEMMNEWKVNKWLAEEVRSAGKDLAAKLPKPYLLSLSSPDAAHATGGTNEQMQASADEIYGGDGSGATEMTVHTMRDTGKWSDPFSYNYLYPHLRKINNEPPGPGVSGMPNTDESQVLKDLNATIAAGWAAYWGHAEWCPWNGHLPQEYHNGFREVRFLKDLPHMPACAAVLKTGETEPEMPIPPYDEGWITGTVTKAVVDAFALAQRPLDPGAAIWVTRTLYDHDAGMTKEASLEKHLYGPGELYDTLGLPH